MEKRTILIYLLIPILVLIDIISKSLYLNKSFVIIKNILEITTVKNTGIAFGLFKGNIIFTIILPIIAIILVTYFFYNKKNNLVQVGLVFVVSGLLGNLISRFIYGYVPDFITIPALSFIFQVFNFSDLFSFIGIILLAIYIIREK